MKLQKHVLIGKEANQSSGAAVSGWCKFFGRVDIPTQLT